MTFSEFKKLTDYSASHLAHCLLYRPNSRPSKMAESLGYVPSEIELVSLRRLIAGKGDTSALESDLKKVS